MTILFIFVFLILLGFLVSSVSGAPWVPARKVDVEKILDDVGLKKGEQYVELGCGDGRLVRAAAGRGAIAVGYELNPLLWFIAWISTLNQKNAHVKFGNFWNVNVSRADVVMAFLVPRTMPRLGIKANKEMKKSSRLVSYIFPIPHKTYTQKYKSWYVYTY